MPEYTISPADGDDWPVLGTSLEAALQPRSFECEILEDSDVLTFRTGTATVGLSWQLVYVNVEDAPSPGSTDLIVDEMARQLAEVIGQQTIPYRLTD